MSYRVEIEWLGQIQTFYNVPGTLTEAIECFGAKAPDRRSFPMAVIFRDVSISSATASGQDLTDAIGRVYLDDSDKPLLTGVVREPQFGADDSPVRFSLDEQAWGESLWPPDAPVETPIVTPPGEPSQWERYLRYAPAASSQSVDLLPGFSIGRSSSAEAAGGPVGYYPVVVGKCGGGIPIGGTDVYDGPGSPMLRVSIGGDLYRVATAGPVAEATTAVLVYGETPSGGYDSVSCPLYEVEDLDGRRLWVVKEDDLMTGPLAASDGEFEAWASWLTPAAPGGAGDVVEMLLRHTRRPVDASLVGQYAAALDQYTLATYWDDPQPLRTVIEDILAPLPACLVSGRDGLYVWVWDPDAPPVAHLVVSTVDELTGVHAAGDQSFVGETVRSVRLRYCLRPDAAASPSSGYTLGTAAYGIYHESMLQQDRGIDKVVQCPHIEDPTTAQRAADLYIRWNGRPSRLVPIRVERARFDLRAGDSVDLTHSLFGLHRRRGVVQRIDDHGEDLLDIVVVLPHDPMRPGAFS